MSVAPLDDKCSVPAQGLCIKRVNSSVLCVALSDGSRTGWARKKSAAPSPWYPTTHVLDPPPLDWRQAFALAELATQSHRAYEITIKRKGSAIQVDAALTDPFFILPGAVVAHRLRQDEGRHGAVGEVDAVRGDVAAL